MPRILYETPDGLEEQSTQNDRIKSIQHNENLSAWRILYGEPDASKADADRILTIPEHRVYEVEHQMTTNANPDRSDVITL